MILCSTYDAGDLPPEAATSGARAYLNKEHLGAETLRRLWEERDAQGVQLGLRPLGSDQRHGASHHASPVPGSDSHRTVPPMAPNRSAMLV